MEAVFVQPGEEEKTVGDLVVVSTVYWVEPDSSK